MLDTTIREFMQTPGAFHSVDEALVVADGLANAATDVIEAGAPGRSAEEFETVTRVAERLAERRPGCTVSAVARCAPGDIVRAAEALRPAASPRLHLILPMSAHFGTGTDRQAGAAATFDLVSRSVEAARGLVGEVQLSVSGVPRGDTTQLGRLAAAAREAGAALLNVCDPVGSAFPQEFADLVGELVLTGPELSYSVRCSNRLGLAVGNTLAGLAAGARQAYVSVGGVGRLSSACSYEDLIKLLAARGQTLGLQAAVTARALEPVCEQVACFAPGEGRRLSGRTPAVARGAGLEPSPAGGLGQELLQTVLIKLCDGVKDETAARQMNVSVRTYRRHVAQLMKELNVSSRFEAGVEAAERGLLRAGRVQGTAA